MFYNRSPEPFLKELFNGYEIRSRCKVQITSGLKKINTEDF